MVCSGSGVWDAPERDVETIEIPGRNGELTIDNGRWHNVTVSYPVFIAPPFRENAAAARAWLCRVPGYRRLEDERYPDVFRKARLTGGVEIAPTTDLRAGRATINFSCAPQRWLKCGEVPVTFTGPGALINPTGYEAQPLVVVYGTGSGSVIIGGSTVAISEIGGSITLDTEIQRAYSGMTPKDSVVSGTFPVLGEGTSAISFSGGVTRVEITPRWWTI